MNGIENEVKRAMGRNLGYNPEMISEHTGHQCRALADKLKEIARGALSDDKRRELIETSSRLILTSEQLLCNLHRGSISRSDLERVLECDIRIAWCSLASGWSVSHRVDEAIYEFSSLTVTGLPIRVDLGQFIEIPD